MANLGIVLGCLYNYFSTIQVNQLKDELRLAAYAVEESGQAYLEKLTTRDDRYIWTPDYRLTWIASDGTVLFDTAEAAENLENHRDRAEVREAFAAGESVSVRCSETLTERTLYYARALNNGTVLRISVSQMTVLALVLAMVQPILLVRILAVILSAVLANRMAKRIVQPLNALDLEHPLENGTYEKLSPLLRRIQQQGQISAQLRELRTRTDEFEQITGHMNEGLVVLDQKGIILSINPAAQKLFGADHSCVRKDFLTAERGHEMGQAVLSALENGHSEIRAEAARLVTLVDDIIHLSQLDEGAAPDRETVDLLETARDVASALCDSAAEKGIHVSVSGESVSISGVRNFLHEMIYNLCENAIKYNVEGGRVDVSVEDRGRAAVLTVRDTGIGIPAECQPRVFERFFRVDKSRSKASGGTGLGCLSLSTSRSITKRR